MRLSALAAVLLGSGAFLALACGDGQDPDAATPSPVPSATAAVAKPEQGIPTVPANTQFSVRDAALFRDALLELASKATWDVSKTNEGYGAFPKWRTQYPDLGIYTPAAPADTLRISVYVNPLVSGSPAGQNNPYLVAFAVADSSGRCAGGTIFGYPVPGRYGRIELPAGAPCTGFAVADAFLGALTVTPTPTSTP